MTWLQNLYVRLVRTLRVAARRRRLICYATWDSRDLAEFERELAAQRTIDAGAWR